ncbi:MAG: patatin-like phospholipase family protein [Halothiobacillaceae bacterium]
MLERVIGLALVAVLLFGCSALPRQQAVPYEKTNQAKLSWIDDVRYVADNSKDMERMTEEVIKLWKMRSIWLASQGKSPDDLPPSSFLAISGGGDKGAYAAGLLNGWTKAGNRPEFALVTGISTGALIAPYAFLGSKHDHELTEFYTNVSSEDLIEMRGVLAALTEDAIMDTTPLLNMIRKQIDRAFLDEVAAEYKKGRVLLVATTNIDATRSVIWNMTKIAASQDPRALELFHNIMLASAAIPAAFPPVMIDVEVDGRPYQEMHVDGGTMQQVFIYPSAVNLDQLSKEHGIQRKRNLYIIMNERIDPEWAQTERRVLNIAERALGTLIHNQGVGDLYKIFVTTRLDNVGFNLAYIPAEFNHPNAGVFNTDYMRALYKLGFDRALKGYEWETVPPGLTERQKLELQNK